MTVQQLVERAFTINGRLGIGRTAGPAESAIALGVLNSMLESWALDRLRVTTILRNRYNLVANQQSYTIGPSGQFNAARPVMVEIANIIVTINGGEGTLPLKVMTPEEYAVVRMKNDVSPVPQAFYNDYVSPNSTLYLYPIPTGTSQLELWTWSVGGPFAALTDVVNFAPGYERAVAAGLAVELAPQIGKPVTAEMLGELAESVKLIKRLNAMRFGLPLDEESEKK